MINTSSYNKDTASEKLFGYSPKKTTLLRIMGGGKHENKCLLLKEIKINHFKMNSP
jgi:hypothetical protein